MRQCIISLSVLALFLIGANQQIYAQKNVENQITDSLTAIVNSYTYVGKVNVTNININDSRVVVSVNDKLANMPFRPDNVKRIYNAIRKILGAKYLGHTFVCQVDNKNIEELIPNFYRTENIDEKRQFSNPTPSSPLVTNIS